MKTIILGAVVLAMWVGVFAYLPTAYVNERCGQIESWFAEKQENPELYPGLTLTADLKEACPSIESNLSMSQSSTNVDRDIWEEIEAFQRETQLRALEAGDNIVSQ